MMIQVIGFLGTIISYSLYTIHLLMLGVIADQFSTMDHIQYISWFVGRNYG